MSKISSLTDKIKKDANYRRIWMPECCALCDKVVDKGSDVKLYCPKLKQEVKQHTVCDYYS